VPGRRVGRRKPPVEGRGQPEVGPTEGGGGRRAQCRLHNSEEVGGVEPNRRARQASAGAPRGASCRERGSAARRRQGRPPVAKHGKQRLGRARTRDRNRGKAMRPPRKRPVACAGRYGKCAAVRGRPDRDERCVAEAAARFAAPKSRKQSPSRCALSARWREGGAAVAMLVPEAEQHLPPRSPPVGTSHDTLPGSRLKQSHRRGYCSARRGQSDRECPSATKRPCGSVSLTRVPARSPAASSHSAAASRARVWPSRSRRPATRSS
jgi:hypothetical protein